MWCCSTWKERGEFAYSICWKVSRGRSSIQKIQIIAATAVAAAETGVDSLYGDDVDEDSPDGKREGKDAVKKQEVGHGDEALTPITIVLHVRWPSHIVTSDPTWAENWFRVFCIRSQIGALERILDEIDIELLITSARQESVL